MARRTGGWLVALMLVLAGATAARAEAPAPRMVSDAEAPLWRGVGRLNIAGNRYCTGTLIAPDQVLTSAHCLFHPVTGHLAHPDEIRFAAGLRRDSVAALRRATALAILPGFQDAPGLYIDPADIALDLALVRLESPIAPDEAPAIPPADWPQGAEPLTVVGYGRDRPLIAALREDCRAVAAVEWIVELDCPGLPGLSGAPVVVMTADGPRLVAVVSAATGTVVSPDTSLVVLPGSRLATLRELLN